MDGWMDGWMDAYVSVVCFCVSVCEYFKFSDLQQTSAGGFA